MSMRPVHQHDCTTCKYLATTIDHRNCAVDWYVHAFTSHTTIIARHGNSGSNYTSYPDFILQPQYDANLTILADGSHCHASTAERFVAVGMLYRATLEAQGHA